MGTIELSERELKVLEAIIDNMQEVKLEKTVYRIRDIFVVLHNYFKKNNPSINRQAIYYSVEKLEEVGLLKKIAKTHSLDSENEKIVYELQLERFDQTRIVQIKNRYGRRKKISKTEKLPKLHIKPSWFTLEPYVPPLADSKSELEIEIIKRRDGILKEITHLENLLKQKKMELKEADNAFMHFKEAKNFLERGKNTLNSPHESAKNTLVLLPREKQVLQEINKYLSEKGGNRIESIKRTLAWHFEDNKIKISKYTIFHAIKGLEEVGLLRVVEIKKNEISRQKAFIYEFDKELFENSKILVEKGLPRNLVSKSIRIKTIS